MKISRPSTSALWKRSIDTVFFDRIIEFFNNSIFLNQT
ncbi:hypothetical protein G436_3476 [Leptospira interrogans serovar Hardjo str. Norma]|uniref:Uncharacterized protein n=1 Tax=Leptospira interrogans serovar Hardjo str. Norma TaxID=1279460 RepID=A0A0M4MWM8_LEPIR|nr:hypothetical protein G436_3476 [Leptospira interrogans serovar Hardjo str. Norma]